MDIYQGCIPGTRAVALRCRPPFQSHPLLTSKKTLCLGCTPSSEERFVHMDLELKVILPGVHQGLQA